MRITLKCGSIALDLASGMDKFQAALPVLCMALGKRYISFVRQNAKLEQSPDGTKWEPLSPGTANRMIGGKKRGYHPILKVTGRMIDAYASYYTTRLQNGIRVGTNVKYAPYQQFGVKSQKRKIPARPWFFDKNGEMPERFRQSLEQQVREELDRCLR